MDLTEQEREVFYSFFGHSESINKIHYCAPNIAKIIQTVAPTLQIIQEKNYPVNEKEGGEFYLVIRIVPIRWNNFFVVQWSTLLMLY